MASTSRDYFAELYVAGIMGDAGWNIYFPKRDIGFDFIATKKIESEIIIRPVQVKGLYPSVAKKDKSGYGYIGELTQLHPEMVLVLPYFPIDRTGVAPACIAYMPRTQVRPQASRDWKCTPANFRAGVPVPRKTFAEFFNSEGLSRLESKTWSTGLVASCT